MKYRCKIKKKKIDISVLKQNPQPMFEFLCKIAIADTTNGLRVCLADLAMYLTWPAPSNLIHCEAGRCGRIKQDSAWHGRGIRQREIVSKLREGEAIIANTRAVAGGARAAHAERCRVVYKLTGAGSNSADRKR